MKQLIFFILTITISFNSLAQQPTVGLRFTSSNVTEGYTLFTPERNNNVYLINNCGEKINEWTFTEKPGLTCYLLENGNLLRAGKDSLEIRDWNNNLIWSYAMNLNGLAQHHDIEPLPNGNILCVVNDSYSSTDIINEGRNPALVNGTIKLDKIVELEPIGTNNANIVWEWKFIDHLVQDFDSTKFNYGSVVNSPQLININYDNGFTDDWTHVNSVDYNQDLDQIIISTRHLNELYIIDHSTTTIEAGGHTGGNSNMGGDILWRWGNNHVYEQGTISDQKLFLQHDAKWVENNYLDEGKITVFNNQNGSNTYSSVHIISPTIINGVYQKSNNQFLPTDFEWTWNGNILGELFYESKKSGVQALNNGNILICETGKGQATEVNKNGDILWVYKNPASATITNQYAAPLDNGIFRAEKYPSTYLGFTGQNLTPNGLIENINNLSDSCANATSIQLYPYKNKDIINSLVRDYIYFNQYVEVTNLSITDITGKTHFFASSFKGNKLGVNLDSGIYFLKYSNNNNTEVVKIYSSN